jgi:hypothetical protein
MKTSAIDPYVLRVLGEAFTNAERKRVLRIIDQLSRNAGNETQWGKAKQCALRQLAERLDEPEAADAVGQRTENPI